MRPALRSTGRPGRYWTRSPLRCRCDECRAAANADNKIRQAARRRVIDSLKAKPCADCGLSYPSFVMQFDHLRDKEFGIGTSVNRVALTKLLAEIDKCEVVCANCHAVRTNDRRQP